MKFVSFAAPMLIALCNSKLLALHIKGKAGLKSKDPPKEEKEFQAFSDFVKLELQAKDYTVGVVQEQNYSNWIKNLKNQDLKSAADQAQKDDLENHNYEFNYCNRLLLSYDCHGDQSLQCGLSKNDVLDFLHYAKNEWHVESIAVVANGCHSQDFWNDLMGMKSFAFYRPLISWVVTSTCKDKQSWFRSDYQGTPWHQFFSGRYSDLEDEAMANREPAKNWINQRMVLNNYPWKIKHLATLASGQCNKLIYDSTTKKCITCCHRVHFLKNKSNRWTRASNWNLQPQFLLSKNTVLNQIECTNVATMKMRTMTTKAVNHGEIPLNTIIMKFNN